MFNEFEEVRIKKTGATGTIVDKSERKGRTMYLIESDVRNEKGVFPIYDAWEEEIEPKLIPVAG